MTSPPATPVEVVASMATASLEETPPSSNLTAADNVAQHANKEQSRDSLAEETQEIQQPEPPPIRPEILENEQLALSQDAAIPQDPQENGPLASDFPPATAADLARMEVMAHMMAYERPVASYGLGIGHPAPEEDMPMDEGLMSHEPHLASSPYMREANETLISAYAMLEFPDGQFYMNTYSVILGRDLSAARAAARRDAEEVRRKEEESLDVNANPGSGEPKTPARTRRDESKYTRSIISESGGILREGDDSDSDDRARRRMNRKASKKSKSTGSSSQRISRRNSIIQPNGKIDYQPQPQARRHAPESAGAVPVDPASLRPSPHDCPLVGIHPPATTAATAYKAISRQHVKIAYNSKKNLFEAEILGRNGAFVDDNFYHHSEVVPLKSGSQLQIGGVVVKFVLPDVAVGETGAENQIDYDGDGVEHRYSEGGKEMSFDFEDTPRDGVLDDDSSEDASVIGENGGLHNILDGDEGEEVDDEGEDDAENSEGSDEEGDEEEGEATQPAPNPPKRRGPGRPPKNGIMSKREQQLAKKEAQQKAKKTLPQPPVTGKNKVGRPRKHPRPETPPVRTEKRKYTKRKPKDPDAAIKREGSQDEEKSTKEKKEKKSTRPPRSPSPTFNEADLTPEQLAKPQANYVTLIHEALSNSPTGQMSLPQIYRAIQRRYPFFVLKCNTNGWQSSVRHNLSQHHAFRKVERDGKGWMWAIVDGVSIEKEKKRRPTPPHQFPPGHLHQQIYRAGPLPQHMVPRTPGMMGPPPPGYPMNGTMPPDVRPGQAPQYPGPPMNGYSTQPPYSPVNGQSPPVFNGPPPTNPTPGPQQAGYSSPYAPKPTSNAQPPHLPAVGQDPNNALQPQLPPGIQQQGRPPYQLGPQFPTDNIARAIETFKTALIGTLKGKSNNAETVVTSAINRVLGITTQSTVPGDPHEDRIMAATRTMLAKLPGAHVPPIQPPQQPLSSAQQQTLGVQAAHTPPVPGSESSPSQQANTQLSNPSKGSASVLTTAPSIARPTFSSQGHAQNRPNGLTASVPRPPMMTPGIARTNSASSTPATSRPGGGTPTPASPAPIPAGGGGGGGNNYNDASNSDVVSEMPNKSVSKPATNNGDNPNPNGKRPLEDADEMGGSNRDFKRLSTTGPPPLKA